MAKKRIKPMTQLQERFVEAFLGEAYFDPIKAYELAGYNLTTYNKYTDSMKVLHSDAVTREINQRMADKDTAYWISDNVIIKQLWKEATDYGDRSSQAARINALVWIGKHIGMWQEKQKEEADTRPIINITTYEIPEKEFNTAINNPEVISEVDKIELSEGIIVEDYSHSKH
ncbi:MAG: hypothetical protein H6961_07030 [Chromatiaceae bacterium]|nr:hypothetical protein [Chromatiaceae bacterium]